MALEMAVRRRLEGVDGGAGGAVDREREGARPPCEGDAPAPLTVHGEGMAAPGEDLGAPHRAGRIEDHDGELAVRRLAAGGVERLDVARPGDPPEARQHRDGAHRRGEKAAAINLHRAH